MLNVVYKMPNAAYMVHRPKGFYIGTIMWLRYSFIIYYKLVYLRCDVTNLKLFWCTTS